MARRLSKRNKLRISLFEEQRGMCWICGGHMHLRKRGIPHGGPQYATFEHVVPAAMGGRFTRSNLKLTHSRCNQARAADAHKPFPETVTVTQKGGDAK